MIGEHGLHLGRPDDFAAGQDRVVHAAEDSHRAVRRELAGVLRAQPPVVGERRASRLWLEAVPAHQSRPAKMELTFGADPDVGSGKWLSTVDDAAARFGEPVGGYDTSMCGLRTFRGHR